MLARARRLYLDHTRKHGCGKAALVDASLDSGSVEEQPRADVLEAQVLLEIEQAWATPGEALPAESAVALDGTLTLAEAKHLWAAARQRYTTALRRFSDYLVRGKLPEAS
jgi:hypothetical protein